MTVLEVSNVTKRFASVQAVGGVSFCIDRGEIFALLGPNGAGKTTLVRMLLGIFPPDSGSFQYSLRGRPGWPLPADLGYLPEDRGLYRDIPILRTLIYFGTLRGLRRREAKQSALHWLERMNLAARAGDKLESLSKGNQQKVQFISAVLHQPAFAILDEPFSGLDPINQDFFAQLIRELRESGMTILLSAHQMQIVEKLADHVMLVNRGREVLSGTMPEIRRKTDVDTRLGLRIRGPADVGALRSHPAVARVETNGDGHVTLLLRDNFSLSDLLVRAGTSLDVVDVQSERLSLHDIYVRALSQNAVNGGGKP